MQFAAIRLEDAAGNAVDRDLPDEELVRARVYGILEGVVLCSMATVTAEGRPHISTAYFSYSEALDLYFLSDPGSLHCRNLSRDSSMAVAVYSSEQQWANPDRGIQLSGACYQASDSSIHEAARSYAGRFPEYADWAATTARRYGMYVFRAEALKVLDESAFGDAVFVRASVKRT